MLDWMRGVFEPTDERRRIGDHVLPVAFLGVAGIAMIVWIAAIAWASWSLITWISR